MSGLEVFELSCKYLWAVFLRYELWVNVPVSGHVFFPRMRFVWIKVPDVREWKYYDRHHDKKPRIHSRLQDLPGYRLVCKHQPERGKNYAIKNDCITYLSLEQPWLIIGYNISWWSDFGNVFNLGLYSRHFNLITSQWISSSRMY